MCDLERTVAHVARRQDGQKARSDIVTAIAGYRRSHGYSPSVRDVGTATGLSPSAVQYHLDCLVELGTVSRDPKIPRSMRLTYGS